jgi:hypothetical protein
MPLRVPLKDASLFIRRGLILEESRQYSSSDRGRTASFSIGLSAIEPSGKAVMGRVLSFVEGKTILLLSVGPKITSPKQESAHSGENALIGY